MRRLLIFGLLLCWANAALAEAAAPDAAYASPGKLTPVDAALPDVFVWSDSCNVYVLRDGEAAVLIDLGDGSVLDHLGEIGVKRVDWVLFTHHHREQCQGYARLKPFGAKVAAPQSERALFEKPAGFRKMRPKLGDAYTVHGASYVRPPVEPIALDRTFAKTDLFEWGGREIRCIETRGNSPGGMSYFLQIGDRWLAFSGDVMLADARMHNWFDTEWDYGFAKGLYDLTASAAMLESFDAAYLLPSHGPVLREPKGVLHQYGQKLRRLAKLYVRGYGVDTLGAADQDMVSRPTSVPQIWQISPHLYKFKSPDFWPNFGILIADSGHALVVDCGLLDEAFLDRSLELMQQRLGLRAIDAVVLTHMHGDHFLQVPHLRERWGAKFWTLDTIADKCTSPERYDYAAMIEAYGDKIESVPVDRAFRSGETFDWEGYHFTLDWMPGQTEFGCCLQGRIDGRLVAFTGDNLFGNPADPEQTGHEAVVARNSAILEEGYIHAGEYLRRLQPDLLVGGHSYVMDRPHDFIERFARWSVEMRDAYRELSAEDDYRLMFDPYWVRADPYRVTLRPGETVDVTVRVRNFHGRPQSHRIAMHVPSGVTADSPVLEAVVAPESTAGFPVKLTASPDTPKGVQIVAFDITLDGRRYGEWFDFVVQVQ